MQLFFSVPSAVLGAAGGRARSRVGSLSVTLRGSGACLGLLFVLVCGARRAD